MTRRDFIGQSVSAALALAAGPASRLATQPHSFRPGTVFAHVVEVRREGVARGSIVNPRILRQMLKELIVAVTGKSPPNDAWRALFRHDDIIGLKFNHVGARALGTNVRLAEAIIAGLEGAGFSRDHIVLIELDPRAADRYSTLPARLGWQEQPVEFASTQDHLASVLDQVTALINVPALKTHRIAGLSGGMKNLSHALVRHPARYHGNRCDPFIAEIVSLPQIRSKVRLTISNAVRVVFDKGPEVAEGCIAAHAALIGSTDVVAVDAVGWEILRQIRRKADLPPYLPGGSRPPQLATAESLGLGVADLDVIRRQLIDLS